MLIVIKVLVASIVFALFFLPVILLFAFIDRIFACIRLHRYKELYSDIVHCSSHCFFCRYCNECVYEVHDEILEHLKSDDNCKYFERK